MEILKGFDGLYKIDREGRIYSAKGLKQPVYHETGYYVISLKKDGKYKSYRYHRLVAMQFIANPENKPFVNHKDGDKLNFHPDNLEWVTEKENSEHAIRTGLFSINGVKNPACRHSYEDVVDWYFLITQGVLIKDIAKYYECDRNSVSRLLRQYYGKYIPKYSGKTFYRGGYYTN